MTQEHVLVGEGAYAKVYKQTFAVKTFANDKDGHAMSEYQILKRCEHPRIIKCFGTYKINADVHIILPFYPQTLARRIQQESIPHNLVKSYLYQLLEGVAYLHSQQRIIHTDLKPQNLLLSSTNQLIICDFSCAKMTDSGDLTNPYHGTLWYRGPELLLGGETDTTPVVSFAMDMWAVGCIAYELVTRQALFRGDCEIDQLFKIFRVCGTPTETVWPGVTKTANFKSTFPQWTSVLSRTLSSLKNPQLELLLHKILVLDPKQRITAQEALKHPYFVNVTAAKPVPVIEDKEDDDVDEEEDDEEEDDDDDEDDV